MVLLKILRVSLTFGMIITLYGVCANTVNEVQSLCSSKQTTPPYCKCGSIASGATVIHTVDCSGQGRKLIPSGVPDYTTDLNFNRNQLTSIKRGNFDNLEQVQRLDLSRNAIDSIEQGSFDKLHRLTTILLKHNFLTTVGNSFFLQLSSLSTIDFSYNLIKTIYGKAFFSLPSITRVALTGNHLVCDCETKKLKQWYDLTGNTVSMVDALCINKNLRLFFQLTDSDFTGCSGTSLFPSNPQCLTCSAARSHSKCLIDGRDLPCSQSSINPAVCYTRLQFTSSGLVLTKGCSVYQTCIANSKVRNPTHCYNNSGSNDCQFCCIGVSCNLEDIGHRTKYVDFSVSFTLDAEMNGDYNNPSSALYNQFKSQSDREVTDSAMNDPSKGSYSADLTSLGFPKMTANFTVEGFTINYIKEGDMYKSLYERFKTLKTVGGKSVLSFKLSSTKVCPADTVTNSKGTIKWPSTEAGFDERVKCPVGDRKYAYRTCEIKNGNAVWGTADLSDCLDDSSVPSVTTIPTSSTTKTSTTTVNAVTNELTSLSKQTVTNEEQSTTRIKAPSGDATQQPSFTVPLTKEPTTKREITPSDNATQQHSFTVPLTKEPTTERGETPSDTTTQNPNSNRTLTVRLQGLSKMTITNANADAVASDLSRLSKEAPSYSTTDINLTISILDDLVEVGSSRNHDNREQDIAKTLSNVLGSSSSVLSSAESDFKASSRFLKTIDKFTADMNVGNKDFNSVNPNLALFVKKSSSNAYNGLSLQADVGAGNQLKQGAVNLVEGSLADKMGASSISLPSTLASELGNSDKSALSKVAFAVYTDNKLFSTISSSSNPSGNVISDATFKTEPNSLILSASIPNVQVENLQNKILFRFAHANNNSKHPQCSFWDTNDKWSTRGCVVKESQDDYTICQCDHLTNFALVMDIYQTGGGLSQANKTALSIISYIGCGVSLLGLILTLITYLMFKKIRSNNPSKVLINLCIALAAMNIIFLLGQQHYSLQSEIGCKIVAVLMHYFLLSAMVWMAIEAFYMYLALVKIFNTYISNFLVKICVVGWGAPLVAVAITLGVNETDNYGFQAGEICWLVPIAFYAAFLAPVLLILILNFISFGLVARTLFGHGTQKLTKSDRHKTSVRLRGAVSVVVLLGLTWVFAIFAVEGGGIVVQYLFTIFNSLQGLFIFIFYCFLNKEARKQWRRKLPCCGEEDTAVSQTSRELKPKSIPGYSTSGTNNTTTNSKSKDDFTDISNNSEVKMREKTNEKRRGKNYPSYLGSTA